jgi:hypothetical protein
MSSPINYHWEDIKEDLVREAEARDRGQTRIEVSGRRDWDGPCVGFVEFHTNGPQGGDAGYGGFVQVAFTNTASTCIEVSVDRAPPKDVQVVAITFRGDAEIDAFIESIEFVAAKLRAVRKLR